MQKKINKIKPFKHYTALYKVPDIILLKFIKHYIESPFFDILISTYERDTCRLLNEYVKMLNKDFPFIKFKIRTDDYINTEEYPFYNKCLSYSKKEFYNLNRKQINIICKKYIFIELNEEQILNNIQSFK